MSWRPFNPNRQTDSELPTLLISADFRSDSYTIHLTDLTHIWSESLQRGDIFRRSKKENTSIDPRDGDQLRVLLDKIKVGIEGGKGTQKMLIVNDDTGKPSITLNITVDLPRGLSPLEWPVHLTSAPQSLLTEQLMIPLLGAQQMRMREMASLTDILRDKDQVIQKLIDRLESQGTQLGQVFPHAAGMSGRKIDRKMAEEKVKGLKLFSMQGWRQGLKREESRNIEQLVDQVFGRYEVSDLNFQSSSYHLKSEENWWEGIKGQTFEIYSTMTSTELPKTKVHDNAKSTPKDKENVQDNDDFQIQETPPHLASAKQKLGQSQSIEDSNEEEEDDDLDAPSQRTKIPDNLPTPQLPVKSPVTVPKKLGVIGGTREPPPVPQDDDETTEGSTPSPVQRSHSREGHTTAPVTAPSPVKPKRTLGTIGGKKTTPEPEQAPPVKEQLKPSRGRLGQVGGKKKDATAVPAEREEETTISPPKSGPEEKKKLGSLGGPKSKSKSGGEGNEAVAETARGRAVKQEEEKEPPRRETSEERANKKREQLKMELEEKAKAPVKKKRKF